MVNIVREVRSRMDYILETDRSLFRKMSVQDPRHNSDHYLILECLRSTTLREHERCLWKRTRLHLSPSTTPTREDGFFVSLFRMIPKPKG